MTNNCRTAIMALDVIIGHRTCYCRWSTYTNCNKILGLGSPDELRRGLSERDHQMVEKTIKNFKIKDDDTHRFCDVIPDQRYMRKLNGRLVDEMMIDQMAVVNARVLPPLSPAIKSSFAWNLHEKKLATRLLVFLYEAGYIIIYDYTMLQKILIIQNWEIFLISENVSSVVAVGMERKPRSKISKQSKKYTFISKQHNVWTTRLRTRATEYKQQNIKNSKGPRWEVVNEGEGSFGSSVDQL
ncbi:unnamed protein product [Rhizophagus irregularis]|nr:unnamed protein product [Rhizophagus irregularis]